jgi:hypothetical protein
MQTTLFSMITFLTTVLMVSSAWGDGNITPRDLVKERETCKKEEADAELKIAGTGKKAFDDCMNDYARLGGGAASAEETECKEAKKAIETPLREFAAACNQFKLKGASCAEKVYSCPDLDAEDEDDGESKKGKKVDKDKYSICPLNALGDAKFAKEQVKELKEEIKDLEEKIDGAKEKVQEAQKDIETAEAERAEANNEREAQFEKESKEKSLEQEGKTEAAQKKIDELEKAMRELEQTKNDQDVQYSVDLAKVEAICEEIAEKALAAQIEGTVKAVQAGQLKKKDLNAQLALASSGRTKQNEDFRKREIARCRADDAKWKKPIELLNLNYQNTRLRIENGMKELLIQKNKIYTELNSTLPQKKQQEAQELQARYQKDVATIKTKFDTKIGQCGNQQAMQGIRPNQTQVPNGCTGLQAKRAQATANQANLEAKLDDKKSDLAYFSELLSLASANVADVGAEDKGLMGAAERYKSAIVSLLDVKNCVSEESKAFKDYTEILNALDTGSAKQAGPSSTSVRLMPVELSLSATVGTTSASNPTTGTSGKPAKSAN